MSFKMFSFSLLSCIWAFMSLTILNVSGQQHQQQQQQQSTTTKQNIMKSPLSSSVDKFTLDFLKGQAKLGSEKNVLFSPLSIQVIYSLLMRGARGDTRNDILNGLRFNSFNSHDDVYPGIEKMMGSLVKESQNMTLLINNLMAISNRSTVESEFKETAKKYRSEISVENFSEGEKVKTKINEWVNQTTRGKIPSILNSPLSAETVLLLLNTIYFQGTWVTPFKVERTRDMNFQNADGTNSSVPMMRLSSELFPSYSNSEFQMLEMPYNGNVSMIFMLPNENINTKQVISNLSDTKLTEYIESMKPTNFDGVSVPRFKVETQYLLHQILPEMGMRKPFTSDADFSGISPTKTKVDQSIHKAVIEVDEKGTVAAAVTSIRVMAVAWHPPVLFNLDRPFVFFLRDKTQSINLFAGIINKLPG
ncbi:iripin-2-like [Brevipalpus obovatus]|uniref:iripin-2-like n=1 Tax=Brevipalpus obovatus TaxID=246614 RepID=UPI003D9FB070